MTNQPTPRPDTQLQTLQRRYGELRNEMIDIDAQLAKGEGDRAWRDRAVFAKAAKMKEALALKQRILDAHGLPQGNASKFWRHMAKRLVEGMEEVRDTNELGAAHDAAQRYLDRFHAELNKRGSEQ